MAQHYIITEELEPKVFKSLKRVAEYFVRASKYIVRYQKEFNEDIIYKKNVLTLPLDHKLNEGATFVIKVGRYDLDWGRKNNPDEEKLFTNLNVECNINSEGKILAAYAII